jgi:hypothetical protein
MDICKLGTARGIPSATSSRGTTPMSKAIR